jgi:hypothetical protein
MTGSICPATKMAFGAGEMISKVLEMDVTDPRTTVANAITMEI